MNSIHLVDDPFEVWEERYKVYVAMHKALRDNHNHYPVTMDQFLTCASFGTRRFLKMNMDKNAYADLLYQHLDLHLKRMASTMGPSYSVSFGVFKTLFEEQEAQAWETISHFASLLSPAFYLPRNHRFTEHSDELRARFAWTTTARANFKHLMYNVRKNAKRACASTDKNQWKEHGYVWMRKEYWTELCDIWGAEKWNENSSKAKQNRAAHPEANVHMSGSVSFATHKARLEVQFKRPPQFQELFDETHKKKETNDYISEKAREVAKSYSRGMDERYGDDSQRPELDPDIWVAASGAPKKGHVYGFGHSLGTTRVIPSCSSSVSHVTSPFTTPAAPGGSSSAAPTMTPDMFRAIVRQ
ncbi:hypothetical protein Taro_029219 [Colocasia esculenta]|uniref:Uncharacterized protein n=1 Tax=Colocasia esculenta TaxID=4460 RepID=A0A843VU88_COLES|nr:hypothetical protein [Colocasia esculenta]